MPQVTLEYDPDHERLMVRGLDAASSRDPLFAAYLRQNGGTTAGSEANIPTTEAGLNGRYQALTKIFARLGVSLAVDDEASNALRNIEEDDRNFRRFAQAADDIWNRNIETEEFRQFVRIIQQTCPGRVFYPKQLLSAYHLAFAQNACNFSVPGAGKTSVVYAAYAFLKTLPDTDTKSINRLLIVGPLSSFKAWTDEYKSIFSRSPKLRRLSGAVLPRERYDYLRGIEYSGRDIEITLTTYPTLAASPDDFQQYLSRSGNKVMMVLDEAHYIKRDDGFWSSAVLKLASKARARVVLTGTPAPNGYEDLANLFKFIYPERRIIGFQAGTLRAMSAGGMATSVTELKSSIRPFYTRIRKSDLGLPPVSETRVPVHMSEKQEQIYRGLERKIVPHLRMAVRNPEAAIRVRAQLIRLRQACVNPELLLRPIEEDSLFDVEGDFSVSELEIADLIKAFDADTDLERQKTAVSLVEDTIRTQGKVIIWSYFIGNLNRLQSALSGKADFVSLLTGATPVASDNDEDERAEETREAIIDRFHRAGETAILIANPQAVGESISLHKACRTAIYYDRDFNAGRYIQSKDRIHRYDSGRQEAVSYFYLTTHSTVDDQIDARLLLKERRLADLVDSQDIPLLATDTAEDADDITAIIEAYERRKTI